jgi:hypothetical protein
VLYLTFSQKPDLVSVILICDISKSGNSEFCEKVLKFKGNTNFTYPNTNALNKKLVVLLNLRNFFGQI